MSTKFQVSPTGAYVNPQIMDLIDENSTSVQSVQTGQPPRKSSILQRLFNSSNGQIGDRRQSNVSFSEDIPRIDFYRRENTFSKRLKRPDLEDLHMPQHLKISRDDEETNQNKADPNANKLGWVDGVYIRTMMNLFGVMLFLRMGWMAGQAGILLALAQILIGTAVTVVTTLSMIALCTNGNIGGGGIYAMISRSVGHEAGGVIGFLFTFTNAAFVGLNLLGTAESVSDILNVFEMGICEKPSAVNDQRIIGYVCLMIVAAIPLISLEFEAKTLMFFFLTLLISLIDYFVGALIHPTKAQMEKGFAYWNSYVISNNLYPRWDGQTFFSVFGVFFPSVTGIFTGASMSADLKNPAKAIPLGTFLAIATTSTIYAIIIIFTGSTIIAYASGNADDILFNNRTCEAVKCPFGLINDYQTMSMCGALSHTTLKVDPLIYAGIFAATLSSALGCYTAAPRIFKAFADDNLIPFISWFGKGYGPGNDPRHGYLVTFIIASVFIAIGDVNAAGVWISNFYLGAFFMVNFSLFHVSWVSSLSFRPSFKYYNKWISLFVGLVCITLMFLFDVLSAAVVIGLTIVIYISMLFVDPVKANWGPSTEEQCFNIARCITFRLNTQDDHVKHYRPMVLLLSGNPTNRRALLDMANLMTQKYGLLFVAHMAEAPIHHKTKDQITFKQKEWLRSKGIKAFYKLIESDSVSNGIKSMMQASGIGKFTPNIVMLGYKTNWQTCNHNSLQDYYEIIHSVLDCHFSLILLRLQEGHDFSDYFGVNSDDSAFEGQKEVNLNSNKSNIYSISKTVDSQISINDFNINESKIVEPKVDIYKMVNRFKTPQKKGNIDVWWIYDDGGLTILMPYILKNNPLWRGCKLRVFSVTKRSSEIDSDQISLTQLLKKFRIPYSDVHVLSDSDQLPNDDTKNKFIKLMSKSLSDETLNRNEQTMETLQSELIRFRDKTNRYLRLRELIEKYSQHSTLVVMTLPIPRKHNVSAVLYMAWIEMLTNEMPPFLLIRGNQSNVLTFYC